MQADLEGPDFNLHKLMVNNQDRTEWKKSSPLKTYSKKSTPVSDGRSRYGRSHKPRLSGDFLSTDKKVSHYLKIDADNQMHYFKSSPYAVQKTPAATTTKSPPAAGTTPRRGRPPKALLETQQPERTSFGSISNAIERVKSYTVAKRLSDFQAPVPTSTETLPIPTELIEPKVEQVSDTEDYNEDDWNVGDLAWACVGGFPYWPCAITKDPDEHAFKKTKCKNRNPRECLHVRFFGDRGRRSWIMTTYVIPFHGIQAFSELQNIYCTLAMKKKDPRMFRAFSVGPSVKRAWQAAVSEAESLRDSPRSERVMYFVNLYPGASPLMKIKEEPSSSEPKKRGRKRKCETPPTTYLKKVKVERTVEDGGVVSEEMPPPAVALIDLNVTPASANVSTLDDPLHPLLPDNDTSVSVKLEIPVSKDQKRKKGRPPGSKNKPVDTLTPEESFDYTPLKRKYVRRSSTDMRMKENRDKKNSLNIKVKIEGKSNGAEYKKTNGEEKSGEKRRGRRSKKENEIFGVFYNENFEKVADENPHFTEQDIKQYINKAWREIRDKKMAAFKAKSKEAAEVASNDSGGESKSESSVRSDSPPLTSASVKTANKRATLFIGVKSDKVCQVCFKAGEILKCRGACGQPFHLDCANKPRFQEVAPNVPREVKSTTSITNKVPKKRGRPSKIKDLDESLQAVEVPKKENGSPDVSIVQNLEESQTNGENSIPKSEPNGEDEVLAEVQATGSCQNNTSGVKTEPGIKLEDDVKIGISEVNGEEMNTSELSAETEVVKPEFNARTEVDTSEAKEDTEMDKSDVTEAEEKDTSEVNSDIGVNKAKAIDDSAADKLEVKEIDKSEVADDEEVGESVVNDDEEKDTTEVADNKEMAKSEVDDDKEKDNTEVCNDTEMHKSKVNEIREIDKSEENEDTEIDKCKLNEDTEMDRSKVNEDTEMDKSTINVDTEMDKAEVNDHTEMDKSKTDRKTEIDKSVVSDETEIEELSLTLSEASKDDSKNLSSLDGSSFDIDAGLNSIQDNISQVSDFIEAIGRTLKEDVEKMKMKQANSDIIENMEVEPPSEEEKCKDNEKLEDENNEAPDPSIENHLKESGNTTEVSQNDLFNTEESLKISAVDKEPKKTENLNIINYSLDSDSSNNNLIVAEVINEDVSKEISEDKNDQNLTIGPCETSEKKNETSTLEVSEKSDESTTFKLVPDTSEDNDTTESKKADEKNKESDIDRRKQSDDVTEESEDIDCKTSSKLNNNLIKMSDVVKNQVNTNGRQKMDEETNKKNLIKDDDSNSSIKSSDTDSDKGKVKGWMCGLCTDGKEGPCFICGKEETDRVRCSTGHCGKVYHLGCARDWPQSQISEGAKGRLIFHCPQHACHTCISDNPGSTCARFANDRLVRCVKCPSTYHYGNYCIPAGTEVLSISQIICPRHYVPRRKGLHHVNASWCFICAIGGSLICCDLCPNSFHAECLKISPPEGAFICEDCETGRYPLYGEIVWVKLGTYRWWPARILFPQEIPENIAQLPHTVGEFAVEFFGSHDYYWVNRGRVFLYHEGDGCKVVSRNRVDAMFTRGVQEASESFLIWTAERANREATTRPSMKPPKYTKIQSNRMSGSVKNMELRFSNITTPCECDPTKPDPCGPEADCLNRLLMVECNPQVCPAGENCCNQNFEKKNYPNMVPFRTENRGWGLKTLDPIPKGGFIIEYVGEMINEEEYKKRLSVMQKNKDENFYFLTIDKDRMLDAGPKGNMARFMNHSCDPNCETQKWTVNGDTRVGLFAVRYIKTDTELVFNYNMETIGGGQMECKCGAPNCTGYIGAKNGKPKIPPSSTNGGDEKKPTVKKSLTKRNGKKSSGGAGVAAAKPTATPSSSKQTEETCFTCGSGGELLFCDDAACPKAYHLSCLGLTKHPAGGWVCPWHQCSVCSATKVQRCTLCINSYCSEHSEGNITVHRTHGPICFSHNLSDSGSDWSDPGGVSDEEELKLTKQPVLRKYSRSSKLINGHVD